MRGTQKSKSGRQSNRRRPLKPIKRTVRSTKRKRRQISVLRLERALRVFSRTKDIAAAARSIGVSADRFKQTVLRRIAKRKRRGVSTIVRRLPRRMPIFSSGKQLAITVRSGVASLIGQHNSAVGQFRETNDPKYLADFKGRGVKDVGGKFYEFEVDPNALYRLSSGGEEPFEDIYRIVI